VDCGCFVLWVLVSLVDVNVNLCWDGEEMKEKVVVLRELEGAIIYNE
jgi:hypothetical protein